MTSIQTTQYTITIQSLYKWDSEESQMTYLNLYPNFFIIFLSQVIIQLFCYFVAKFLSLTNVNILRRLNIVINKSHIFRPNTDLLNKCR